MIASITGCTDIQFFNKGLSLRKFKGKYDGENVIIRIFPNDNYYGDRYLREQYALYQLEKFKEEKLLTFIFPQIIKEFDKSRIRVLEWIDGNTINVNQHSQKVVSVLDDLSNLKINSIQFKINDDIKLHLKNTNNMHQEDRIRFERISSIIIKDLNLLFVDNNSLIHGDFYHENILFNKKFKKIGIIDWEYASSGSIYYDFAYLNIFSNWSPPEKLISKISYWKPIVTAILCHWYLTFQKNNRKVSKFWLNRLENSVNT